jgi:anti-sigma regulatory factor (Ser/Thr protein kinase)/CheY-like chemotaxis protein
MLDGSMRLWEDQAQAKGLEFRRTLEGCPGPIVGDAARLRQIVFNLMSNALKFTVSGSVTLDVTTTADQRLRIAVRDTGVGIAPDKLDDIFESFRQADTSTTRQFGGTGLGLAICRNLARAMGGDVTVSSTPGDGSCCLVDMPLVRADPAIATAAADATTPGLLIVDRNPISRSMLKTLMTPHAGEVVVTATTGDAIAALTERGAERVLVDAAAILAEEDPVEAARALLASARHAPVTMLWPAGTDELRTTIETIGRFRSVFKPVSGTSLVAFIYPPDDATLVSRAA